MSRVDPLENLKNFEPKAAVEKNQSRAMQKLRSWQTNTVLLEGKQQRYLSPLNAQDDVSRQGGIYKSILKGNLKLRMSYTASPI